MVLSGQDGRRWRKSSHSGGGNDCVEIAGAASGAVVRDSKNPDGPRLRFGAADWSTFVHGMGSTPLPR